MTNYSVGAFIGALLITFLLSRLIGRGLRRLSYTPAGVAILANAATLAVATVVGGYGFANRGSPQFIAALLLYAPAAALWFVYDVVRNRNVGQS